jgi:CMP-2-keto-3-deoxyoctulosonic acid synthetase
VNLQGDEPAFPEDGLRTLCAALRAEPDLVHLLVHEEEATQEETANPNRVKVAVDGDGFAVGVARHMGDPCVALTAALTGARDARRCVPPVATWRLQLGAYAYSRPYLAAYAALPPSADEIALSHEMLRAPGLAPMRAHGAPLKHGRGASVDVPEDLSAAERALSEIRANAPNTERQPSLQGAPA